MNTGVKQAGILTKALPVTIAIRMDEKTIKP
ncbi:MAG: hypothetical protein MAGBODY4_00383 [Candidatus Marinimicrobia bacterium]|nr:hypothetical protein [Candidatus Neomarinimicrobiota bacterium]